MIFEQNKRKILAFRRFVDLQLVILIHCSKFKIDPIFIEQVILLRRDIDLSITTFANILMIL
jgi:hypothetical protein